LYSKYTYYHSYYTPKEAGDPAEAEAAETPHEGDEVAVGAPGEGSSAGTAPESTLR